MFSYCTVVVDGRTLVQLHSIIAGIPDESSSGKKRSQVALGFPTMRLQYALAAQAEDRDLAASSASVARVLHEAGCNLQCARHDISILVL
jgi:hypothetical protein